MRLTLNGIKRKGGIGRTKAARRLSGRQVNIWSGQWKAWWRAESSGYTDDRQQAGIYSFEDAFARTKHCGPEKRIEYFSLPQTKD